MSHNTRAGVSTHMPAHHTHRHASAYTRAHTHHTHKPHPSMGGFGLFEGPGSILGQSRPGSPVLLSRLWEGELPPTNEWVRKSKLNGLNDGENSFKIGLGFVSFSQCW